MELYHGSNVPVEHPQVLPSDRLLDFGTGFYLTSDKRQAENWAKLATMRRKTGRPIVTVYEFDRTAEVRLRTLAFIEPDAEWLRFTAANRTGRGTTGQYDLIIGPVATDTTAPVIAGYYEGIYDENEAIRRLMPYKLKDQFAFKTEEALQYLVLKEVITL